jgi:hypothetical protein
MMQRKIEIEKAAEAPIPLTEELSLSELAAATAETVPEEQKDEQKNLEEEGKMEEEMDAEDWSDSDDPVMQQEEQQEHEEDMKDGELILQEDESEEEGGEVYSEHLGEADPEDGSEKFSSMEEAKEALLESTRTANDAKALEAFRQQVAVEVKDAVGAEGSVVVGLLEKIVCPEKHYIHHTFIHFDHKSATLACRPCHTTCSGFCWGPNLEECAISEHEGMTQSAAQIEDAAAATSMASSLEQSLHDLLQDLTEESYGNLVRNQSAIPIETDIPGIKECLANSTCTVESTYMGEVSGKEKEDETTDEITFSTTVKVATADYESLKPSMRIAIDEATESSGFAKGVFEEPKGKPGDGDPLSNASEDLPTAAALNEDSSNNLSAGEDSSTDHDGNSDVDEDLDEDSSNDLDEDSSNDADMAERANTSSALQEDSEQGWFRRRRRRRRRMTAVQITNVRLKASAKSWTRWQAKRKAKDFAKAEIANWLKTKKAGYCTAAMDHLIGASQTVYGCVLENIAQLKKATCDPSAFHRTVKENVDTAVSISKTLKTVSYPLQWVPYVGPVARTLYKVSKLFLPRAQKIQSQLYKLRTTPYGTAENSDCCPIMPTKNPTCKHRPGWKYKCGGCQSGVICYAQQACNTLIKIETKMNDWKAKYYDPVIEKLSEAVMMADHKIENGVLNGNSLLKQCGLPNCVDAEKFAKGVKNKIDSVFHNKICPIQAPKLSMPDLGIVKMVLGWLGKIKDVFGRVNFALNYNHCISVPRVKFWTERKCTSVWLPCCSWGRRRRWSGFRCGSCRHRVCAPVPRSRAWMERVCFSAMHIIRWLNGAMKTLFGVIIRAIERAINALLRPIMNLINSLIDRFFAPLNALFNLRWPSLPMMSIDLPTFTMNCNTVKAMVR